MKTKQKPITLDEFCQEAKAEVDRFRRTWVKGMKTQPENYPPTMPNLGEWWAQHEAFSSSPED